MKRIATILLCLSMAACTKEDTTATPSNDKGVIRFSNSSSNPYTIYLDGGSQGTLQGNKYQEFKVNKGDHDVKAEQQSGYVIYPTVRTATISIYGGDSKEFAFP